MLFQALKKSSVFRLHLSCADYCQTATSWEAHSPSGRPTCGNLHDSKQRKTPSKSASTKNDLYTPEKMIIRKTRKIWQFPWQGKLGPVANGRFVMMTTCCLWWFADPQNSVNILPTALEHDMKTRLPLSNSLSLAWNSEDSGLTLWDTLGPFKLPSCATSHSTFPP